MEDSDEWSGYDATIFPLHLALFDMVSEDNQLRTFAFKTDKLEQVKEWYQEQKPGLKVPRGASKNKTDRALKVLGKVPKGIIPGLHGNSETCPGALETQVFVCQHLDVNKQRTEGETKAKVTHIEGGGCKFRVVYRRLADEHGISLFTFDRSNCVHTCSGQNIHRLPLTPKERLYLVQALLRYDSPKDVFQKIIHPEVQRCVREGRTPTRMIRMSISELKRFAKRAGICKETQPGEDDLRRARELLLDFQRDGSTIAYKLPGHTSDSAETILNPEAKELLLQKDLFMFLMTPLQISLLRRYGTCIATDGTHVVFSYNNIKLIAVLVTSFSPTSGENVKERGFPVALVLTTSEREDIHKAIVLHIRQAVGPTWAPKIVMTDMAFSAFNAWRSFFPDCLWLWCGFHVWQAWIKRLRTLSRPDDLDDDTFRRAKCYLIHEIKELICPKKEPETDLDAWCKRCELVSKALWALGLDDAGRAFDTYVQNRDRWAPALRRAAVVFAFGMGTRLPMLARSNNSLERWFGVLKYLILGGVSCATICAFLVLYGAYQSQIYINALEANALPDLKEPSEADGAVLDGIEEACGAKWDSNAERNDDESSSETDNEDEDDQALDELLARKQNEDKQIAARRLLAEFEEIRSAMDSFKEFTADDWASLQTGAIQSIQLQSAKFRGALQALRGMAQLDDAALGHSGTTAPFVKQRENFGSSETFTIPKMSLSPLATGATRRNAVGTEGPSEAQHSTFVQFPASSLAPPITPMPPFPHLVSGSGSPTAPFATSTTPPPPLPDLVAGSGSTTTTTVPSASPATPAVDSEIELQCLYKQHLKKAKFTPDPKQELKLEVERVPFTDFVNSLLAREDMQRRLNDSKSRSSKCSFPHLRTALSWNTKVRIQAVAFAVLQEEYTRTLNKPKLVDAVIDSLSSFLVEIPPEVSSSVADIGIMEVEIGNTKRREVVLLRANGYNNSSEPCVGACEDLAGWVIRDKKAQLLDTMPLSGIAYGRLIEKRREVTL